MDMSAGKSLYFTSRIVIGWAYALHDFKPMTHDQMLRVFEKAGVEYTRNLVISLFMALRRDKDDGLWRILVPEEVAFECRQKMVPKCLHL